MRKIRIGEEESGQRLDKFLRRYLPGAGQGLLYKSLRKKNILLDGKKAAGNEILQNGSTVCIYFSEETIRNFQSSGKAGSFAGGTEDAGKDTSSEKRRLADEDVIYIDEDILLVNKPAGVLTQKAEKNDLSLVELVRAYLLEKGLRTEEDRFLYEPGPANRLDRNTSGLVAVPLRLAAAQQLSGMFRERTIHKRYLALAAGDILREEHLTAWCVRDERTRKTDILAEETPGADRIETICRPIAAKDGRTLLEVTLVTGKTHQIRSHLQACGHPLIGDPKYGAAKSASGLKRQFLHAWQLAFPACEGRLADLSGRTFTAPLPPDLQIELKYCEIQLPELPA